jgi:hypothetical protein
MDHWLCIVAACTYACTRTHTPTRVYTHITYGQYHGILINGYEGTQLYDPFNVPHATGGLALELPTGENAAGAAVINGPLAYFASGGPGMRGYSLALKIRKFKFVSLVLAKGVPAVICKHFRHIVFRLRFVHQRHAHSCANAGSAQT